MTREAFEKRLAELDELDEHAIASLVTEYLQGVDEGLTALVRMAGAPGPMASKARSLLNRLGETTTNVLSREIDAKPIPDFWMLFYLSKGIAGTEAAVTTRLTAALGDARRVDPPWAPMLEEQELPFRICDEAYLALRRISTVESALQLALQSRRFLALPEEQRNEEIQKYRKTKSFTAFSGVGEAYEE